MRNAKKYGMGMLIVWLMSSCQTKNQDIPDAGPSVSSGAKMEMWEEPRHHLVLSQKGIKVMEVRIPPQDTSMYHTHRYATLYNIINDVNLSSQEYGEQWSFDPEKKHRERGELTNRSKEIIQENSYHRVANDDTSTFHLIAILNTNLFKDVENDNFDDWFVHHAITVDKQGKSELLTFSNPVLVVQNNPGETAVQQENIIHSFNSEAGSITWIPANTPFSLLNDSPSTIAYNLFEIKE